MKNERLTLCLTFHHPLWLQLGTAAERQQPCFPLCPHICRSRRYKILIQLLMHFMCPVFLPFSHLTVYFCLPFAHLLSDEFWKCLTQRDRIICISCWYHPSLQIQPCSTQWVTPPATSWLESVPVYRAKNQCQKNGSATNAQSLKDNLFTFWVPTEYGLLEMSPYQILLERW